MTKYRLPLFALLFAAAGFVQAQSNTTENVVVTGEEIPSAYGAPPGISRTRFAPLTTAYVLPPWAFYLGTIYEGTAFRHGPPDHLFTQEVEMGLPYRFGIAVETAFDRFNGGGGPQGVSIEARYALADWNKIPLNPTIFFEYKFGTGPIRREETASGKPPSAEEDGMGEEDGDEEEEEEEEGGAPQRPDAFEFRLLLSQDFGHHLEWALNGFFEQETSLDEGREWGFAQSAVVPILLPNERLKTGIEMMYRNFTTKVTRDEPEHTFIIGPTIAWKPSRSTRFDVSALAGCTDESPRVQVFAVFSLLLGPPGAAESAEAPVSTRNR